MGCACSRDEPDVEVKITEAENRLRYNKKTKLVATIHRSHSQSNKFISKETLNTILESINDPEPVACADFYDNLKKPDGRYQLSHLAVLGIMLSVGTPHEKADNLFTFFDEGTGEISKEELINVISIMLEIAVDKLPLLAGAAYPKSALYDYVIKLKENKTNCLTSIIKDFQVEKKATISSQEFQAVFGNEDNKYLLSPTNLRKKVYQAGSKNLIS